MGCMQAFPCDPIVNQHPSVIHSSLGGLAMHPMGIQVPGSCYTVHISPDACWGPVNRSIYVLRMCGGILFHGAAGRTAPLKSTYLH